MHKDNTPRGDCFARRGDYCKVTCNNPPRDCANCRFYKTKRQLALDRKAARERLKEIGYVRKEWENVEGKA